MIAVPSVSPFPGALQLEALLWLCNLLIPNYPRWWVRHSYARACIRLDPLLTFLKRHDGTRQQVIRIRHFCRKSSQLRHPGGCTDEQPGIELIIMILTLEAESWWILRDVASYFNTLRYVMIRLYNICKHLDFLNKWDYSYFKKVAI